jgi:hypothetical protein
MAKIKPIYLIGAAAIAAYLFRNKLFGAKMPTSEIDQQDAANPDAVVDTTKTGQTVSQAIETAKQIAQGVQDVKVLIKTPRGEKDITLTKGAKKPRKKRAARPARADKRAARLEKRAARKARRGKKKATIIVEPTQSSLTSFEAMSEN